VTNSICLVQVKDMLCVVLFRPNVMPSSPVVSLSSDTVDQVCRENVSHPDLVDLWASWQQNVDQQMWPYNALESWLVYVYTVFTNDILCQSLQ